MSTNLLDETEEFLPSTSSVTSPSMGPGVIADDEATAANVGLEMGGSSTGKPHSIGASPNGSTGINNVNVNIRTSAEKSAASVPSTASPGVKNTAASAAAYSRTFSSTGAVPSIIATGGTTGKNNAFSPQRHFDAQNEHAFLTSVLGGNSSTKLTRSDTAPPIKENLPPTSATKSQQNPPRVHQIITASTYAEHLALVYFSCHVCHRVAQDPIQIQVPERVLACRRCATRMGSIIQELPFALIALMQDVCNKAGTIFSGMNHVRSIDNPAEEFPNRLCTPKPKRQNVTASTGVGISVHKCLSKSNAAHTPFERSNSTPNGDVKLSAAPHEPSEEEAEANKSNGLGGEVGQASTGAVSPRTDPPAGLGQARRSGGVRVNNHAANAIATRRTGSATGMASRPSGPTSRQLKMDADKKYENAEYTAALELYTKAIELQPRDNLTQLKFLYGNRSAAHFMAQRYAECVLDCLEVVSLDPTNVKMICRAARSAATMGDLGRAIEIFEMRPEDSMTDAMSAELNKYKTGLEIYQKAERNFGTAEGDERYRMLVAQFSDTIPFRTRYAESLMKQKQYMKASEMLEVVSSLSRTPKLCKLMAQCFYQSGFEYFDRAKKCLSDAAQLDEECADLLKLIALVEEGKQEGNQCFAAKNFSSAVSHYTAAIQHASDNNQILRILYCNRAAAQKELGHYREGIEDCTKAILIDENFFKAYARRARCHQHLGDYFAAVQDFKKALQYDPADRELAKELRAAEYSLSKEAEREKDYYYQLGVKRTSTEKEIKAKYRELSLRWHPDKCIGLTPLEKERAEHKFKVVSEAHATLIDLAKRREYDIKMDRERLSRPGVFGSFSSTYSSSNSDYFRGQNRNRSGPGGFW